MKLNELIIGKSFYCRWRCNETDRPMVKVATILMLTEKSVIVKFEDETMCEMDPSEFIGAADAKK